jgi:Transmembrane secretion effector
MATFGGAAGGSWLWGVVAAGHGVAVALLASAAVLLASVALGLRFRLPEVEDVNLDPLRPFAEPQIAVNIEPRSGPVVITIEYKIAEEDIFEFLAAMAERRRIRRRDGARHWTLLRDLQDPQLWIERYHTPTWLDYVRHNRRITHADAAIAERVRALHRGEDGPRVHRMIERQTGSLPARHGLGPREMADPLTDPTRSS